MKTFFVYPPYFLYGQSWWRCFLPFLSAVLLAHGADPNASGVHLGLADFCGLQRRLATRSTHPTRR